MTNKKLYLNNMLTAALLLGVALSLPTYLLWAFNVNAADLSSLSWIQTLYLIGVSIFILKYYGVKSNAIIDPTGVKGRTYGSAFGFSFLTALLSSVIMAILSWIFLNYIDSTSMVQTLELTEQAIYEADPDASQDMIDLAVSMTQFFFSFWGLLISSIFSMAIWGGLAGLVSAAFIKRAPQCPEVE